MKRSTFLKNIFGGIGAIVAAPLLAENTPAKVAENRLDKNKNTLELCVVRTSKEPCLNFAKVGEGKFLVKHGVYKTDEGYASFWRKHEGEEPKPWEYYHPYIGIIPETGFSVGHIDESNDMKYRCISVSNGVALFEIQLS